MLAVIGRPWLSMMDERGRRRLDDPDDWVRITIEAALERNIPVIPVLVQGASMPRKSDLPPSLDALAYRNGIEVRADQHSRSDVTLLMSGVAQHLRSAGAVPGVQNSDEGIEELLRQGWALSVQGAYAEAMPLFERATQRVPHSFDAWRMKAEALGRLFRIEEALVAYNRATDLDPSDADTWSDKAEALIGVG